MIQLHKVLVADDAWQKVKDVLASGTLTEGPRVKEFEALLSGFFGVPVLATNSCTSAIDLALHLCGVGPGDEVISTPITCAASTCGVARRGAKLVWADVNRETGLIDPGSVMRRLTKRTKAVIVVDWGGRPVDCYDIPCTVPIIQDAAHSFGARACLGSPAHVGSSSGSYVTWSYQAIKHCTAGDAGSLKVPPHQMDRARRLRWFGIDRETKAKFRFLQDIPEAGYKYHLSDYNAALGIANFQAAVKSLDAHRWNATWLHEALKECRVVRRPPPDEGSSWWFYSLRTPKPLEFVEFAEARGVGAGPVHGRNDFYSAYDRGHHPLPGVDEYYSQHVAIPCGWWLSQDDLDRIAAVVLDWDRTL